MTSPESSLRAGAYRFTVADKFAGLRLDQYLAESSDSFSCSLAKHLIDIGGVHLAGRRNDFSTVMQHIGGLNASLNGVDV